MKEQHRKQIDYVREFPNLDEATIAISYLPFAIVYDKLRYPTEIQLMHLMQEIERHINVSITNI